MAYQIVVGVDGSEHSGRALHWAIDEGQLRAAELTAVFAWQTPMIGVPGAFNQAELEQSAKQLLADAVARANPPDGLPVKLLVARGDATASLVAACEHADADLLVLGSRGRGGFAGLLLGSVSHECATHAPCPVLIVKNTRHRAG